MVRIVDQESRKREVLAAVVENYIRTQSTVSSEDICKHFDCSSATMRSIMSDLESLGYLTHIHTSGGRVPTDKGYRYYVDVLLSQMELLEDEKQRITREYSRQLNKLEDILERASQVLSDFTRCAGIVSSLDKIYYKGAAFMTEYQEFNDVQRIRNVLLFLEEKEQLLNVINRNLEKKINIYIGYESACKEIADCSLIISTYNVEDRPLGRLAVLGPRSMNYEYIIPAVEYVSGLVGRALENL